MMQAIVDNLHIDTGRKEAARVVIDEAYVERDEVTRRVRHLARLYVDIADNGGQRVVKAKRHPVARSYDTIQCITITFSSTFIHINNYYNLMIK